MRSAGRAVSAAWLALVAAAFGPIDAASLAAPAAAALPAPPGPCSLVTRADIVRVLHWTAPGGHESAYHLPQSTGLRCVYEAHEGSVLVVVPDSGSSFLQNNDLVDPFRNGLGTRVPGVGDSAQMFDNTIYISKHGTSISIAALTTDGTTSPDSLVALGRIAAHRMP